MTKPQLDKKVGQLIGDIRQALSGPLEKDLLRQEKEEKFEAMLDSIRWSPTGKAALLDLLLETYKMDETDAMKDCLIGPVSEEAEELIETERHRWKGYWHG